MADRRPLFVHTSSALRREVALRALAARGREAEIVVVGATLGAVDDLARASTKAVGASLGIHRRTTTLHALEIAAPRLAERGVVPATHLAVLGTLRAALERARTVRTDPPAPAITRGLLAASHRTVSELRLGGVAPDAIPQAVGAEPIAVATLLAAYEEIMIARGLADAAEIFREATRALEEGAAPVTTTLLCDVPIRSPLEAAFVAALVNASGETSATAHPADDASITALAAMGFVAEGEGTADTSPLDGVRRALFGDGGIVPGDAHVELVAAANEPSEALEIARRIVRAAEEGVRFDEIAIALSSPGLYAHHVEEALRRASVPAYFATGSGGAPDPNGRALALLLAYKAERHAAARFLEFLSLGRAPAFARDGDARAEELGTLAPIAAPPETEEPNEAAVELRRLAPRRLESLFKGALLGLGADTETGETLSAFFDRRIEVTLRRYEHELERAKADDAQTEPLERDLRDLASFRDFLLPLAASLDALPTRAPWGTWVDRLSELAIHALSEPNNVLARLADLRALDGRDAVDVHEVRGVVTDRLLALYRPPLAQRAGRVFVAHPRELYGRLFRRVFAPGLSERVFPARPRPDPLFDDERRIQIGLQTTEHRAVEERFLLHLVFGAATDRVVVSYPRMEWTIGRPRVPSFYALDVARATTGALPRIDDLEQAARDRATLGLAWPAPARREDAIDLIEHDLATVRALLDADTEARGTLRPFLEDSPHLARSLRQRYARLEQTTFTPNDGLVRPPPEVRALLAKRSPRAMPYATSTLQDFAPCPYRFFLSGIVGIPKPRPREVLEEIDPRTRGDLFHDTLAAFLRDAIDRGTYPLDAAKLPAARASLRAAFDVCAAAVMERVHPAFRKVFDRAKETIWEDLEGFLRREMRPGETFAPIHADLAFGLPRVAHRDPASREEPVIVETRGDDDPEGSLRVKLKGAIDAVERDRESGAVRITDYKTGALRDRGPLLVGGGEVLQGLLYGLAYRAMFPASTVSGARFYFATARGAFEERPLLFSPMARIEADRFFSLVVRAIEEGFMPAWPKDGACTYCAYLAVCGTNEEVRSRTKAPRHDVERHVLDELVQLRRRP